MYPYQHQQHPQFANVVPVGARQMAPSALPMPVTSSFINNQHIRPLNGPMMMMMPFSPFIGMPRQTVPMFPVPRLQSPTFPSVAPRTTEMPVHMKAPVHESRNDISIPRKRKRSEEGDQAEIVPENRKKVTKVTARAAPTEDEVPKMQYESETQSEEESKEGSSSSYSKKHVWSVEDDCKLLLLHAQLGSRWSLMVSKFENRSSCDLKSRFRAIIRAQKRAWTPEEDAVLLSLPLTDQKDWHALAAKFPCRTSNALKYRYRYLWGRNKEAYPQPKEDLVHPETLIRMADLKCLKDIREAKKPQL
jgi:hypothetical protein